MHCRPLPLDDSTRLWKTLKDSCPLLVGKTMLQTLDGLGGGRGGGPSMVWVGERAGEQGSSSESAPQLVLGVIYLGF